jgi:uncharacterized protein YjbI with pentapeptide repeats
MKFDIFNRWSGEVQFAAEIDCAADTRPAIKIGLAIKWAYANRASLDGAILYDASLDGASLNGASLNGASLVDASLVGARLDGASLVGARLNGARLVDASLVGARLDGACLDGARLDGARLNGACLDGARLDGARLNGARLNGACLDGARLNGAIIKDALTLGYPDGWGALTYLTTEGEHRVQIGCQNKTIAEGRAYWKGKPDRREIMAVLHYADAIAKIRGWIAS